MDVSHVAGLRLVSNALEFLDERGSPQLRVAPPYVVDARGERHEGTLTVEGCAYDVNPAAPWGREVTRPGAESCEVRVAWGGGVVYPAIVDPSWTVTGSMATARIEHTASVLASGMVLVVGGGHPDALFDAELYDPTSGRFAAAGSMTTRRSGHTASVLASGRVLVAGGFSSGSLASAELYDPASGRFEATGSMTTERQDHTANVLASGKVLIAGGQRWTGITDVDLASAELYDPASGHFEATGSMTTERDGHTANVLASRKVLIAGGWSGTGDARVGLASAELYDPASGHFEATGSMTTARDGHTASVLASGKVLITGGGTSLASAELYDPASGRFAATGSMTRGRFAHTASVLASGKVLITGGSGVGGYIARSELYDPVDGLFVVTSSLQTRRDDHTASVLASGKVLVVGGITGEAFIVPLESAELFTACSVDCGDAAYCNDITCLPKQTIGASCAAADQCLSGFCVDGVCCESACSGGVCDACSKQAGSSADGICTLLTGPSCDDGDACTRVDACERGTCVGSNPVTCAAPDACHDVGACDPANGQCSVHAKPDGSSCSEGDQSGSCIDGACTISANGRDSSDSGDPGSAGSGGGDPSQAGTSSDAGGADAGGAPNADPDGAEASGGGCSASGRGAHENAAPWLVLGLALAFRRLRARRDRNTDRSFAFVLAWFVLGSIGCDSTGMPAGVSASSSTDSSAGASDSAPGTSDSGGASGASPCTPTGAEDCATLGDEDCDGVACSDAIWSRLYPYATPRGVATDAAGDVFVAGDLVGTLKLGTLPPLTSAGADADDVFLAKLDPQGTPLWAQRYGDADSQGAKALAVDDIGNVVVAGDLQGTMTVGANTLTQGDVFVMKIDTNGNPLWSKAFGPTNSLPNSAWMALSDVALDPTTRDVVVVGYFSGSMNYGSSILSGLGAIPFVAKLASDTGDVLWSKQLGTAVTGFSTGVAIDPAGNIFVGGYFYGDGRLVIHTTTLSATSATASFVAKLDARGNPIWAKAFGGVDNSTSSSNELDHIAADSTGNVFLYGNFWGSIDFGGASYTSGAARYALYLAGLDATGAHLWSKPFAPATGATGAAESWDGALAIDAAGNPVIAGRFFGTVNLGGTDLTTTSEKDRNAFLARFSGGTGAHLWSKRLWDGRPPGPLFSYSQVSGLAVDRQGRLLLSGAGAFGAEAGMIIEKRYP